MASENATSACPVFSARAPKESQDRWRQVAKRSGLTFNAWVLRSLEQAARYDLVVLAERERQ